MPFLFSITATSGESKPGRAGTPLRSATDCQKSVPEPCTDKSLQQNARCKHCHSSNEMQSVGSLRLQWILFDRRVLMDCVVLMTVITLMQQ